MALAAPPGAVATCVPTSIGRDVPTALILTGGGAKGAYEAGAVAALAEAGVRIRLVAGSSAGALSAAMIAAGRADRLETTWRSLTRERIYSVRAPTFFAGLLPGWLTLRALSSASSLLDPRPLRELIASSVELERIRSSAVGLIVTTTDIVRREPRVFDNHTVTVDALLAAAAVPGLFPAVEVDGALLVDGGLTGRAPVLEALEAAPVGRALIVLSYAPDERAAPPTTIRRSMEEAFETAMLHQIRRDTELARLKHPTTEFQLLTPSAPLNLRPLEFDGDAVARVLALGRADAESCLRALGGPTSER
ncbi:MAG TPA: patatin-like phospholipase family protein [Methylomirabilota bacterium]|nr:patatin-like phospholipase family protein [Methylomirabilota bacterium]